MKSVLIAICFFGLSTASAQEAPEEGLHHQSEIGIATVSGNAESETYSLKQKTSYATGNDKATLTGRYLRASSAGLESARNWDATLRYDRALRPRLSVFAAYGAESDVFAGYLQRNNADLGGKYEIVKTEESSWSAEAGYRHTSTIYTTPPGDRDTSASFLRLFTDAGRNFSSHSQMKMELEYLVNAGDGQDYRINAEPSLVTQLNDVLALKVGYMIKYQNAVTAPVTERTDSFFTTSMVAKF